MPKSSFPGLDCISPALSAVLAESATKSNEVQVRFEPVSEEAFEEAETTCLDRKVADAILSKLTDEELDALLYVLESGHHMDLYDLIAESGRVEL